MRSQRSQSMVEFAIVAPLLLLLIFGIVDFGRVIYVYITLNQAVNEAVRVAIRDSALLPTNGDVETAAKIHAVDVGLAIDGGRAYLDRRHLQAAADAAALAAAYNYMNTTDYSQAEQIAVQTYASNEALYGSATCAGLGTLAASCSFNDPWGQQLSINVTNRAIAGVSFAVTVTHSIPVAIMQVLGSGQTINISAVATAVARRAGTNGAAIQTLAPAGCGGNGGQSLTFQGSSRTFVTGDVWSNGSVFDNSASAGGSINGNVIDICGAA